MEKRKAYTLAIQNLITITKQDTFYLKFSTTKLDFISKHSLQKHPFLSILLKTLHHSFKRYHFTTSGIVSSQVVLILFIFGFNCLYLILKHSVSSKTCWKCVFLTCVWPFLKHYTGPFLSTYCVQYPHAVPFLRNKMPFSLIKSPKWDFYLFPH